MVSAALGLGVALILPGACAADAGARLSTARAVSAATAPAPGPRPIIFLPGIAGSYLTDSSGSIDYWPNAQALSSAASAGSGPDAQKDYDALKYDAFYANGTPAWQVDVGNGAQFPLYHGAESDPAPDTMGGVLTRTTVTHDMLSVTLWWYRLAWVNAANSGYTIARSDDASGLSACSGIRQCFVPIGVDWRLSAASNAARVLAIIDQVLAVTGSDRVDIVAHSQGGLIAEAIVHDQHSVGKIYRIVTEGTPFLGAPKLLTALLYANVCLIPAPYISCALNYDVARGLIENYPGAAELSPSRAYFAASASPLFSSAKGNAPLTYDEANQEIAKQLGSISSQWGTARDASLISAAESFHDNVDAWAPLDSSVGLLRMVGYDASGNDVSCNTTPCNPQQGSVTTQGTIGQVDTATSHAIGYVSGDGTVPFYSASLFNPQAPTGFFDARGGASNLYWCAMSHMGLAVSTDVWAWAKDYLDGSKDYADQAANTCPGGGVGSLPSLLPATLGRGFGAGVPFSSSPIDFGSVAMNSYPSAVSLPIRNLGQASLTVNSMTLAGDPSYTYRDSPGWGANFPDCGPAPFVIVPGSGCRVSISFAPSSPGTKTATLTAVDNTPNGSDALSLMGSGRAQAAPSPSPGAPAAPGYWLVARDGGIFPFGSAGGYGSTGGIHLNQPVVGMARTPDGGGYWLVASDGGIFPFGDAAGYGSTGAIHLNQPIVGMAATPDGGGYWLLARDGGIFPFGDARGFGSTGGMHLNSPILGMAATPDGGGYWLVASDGGVFPFGDAGGYGSTGAAHLNSPIVGMAATPSGHGYWLVASDGGIFPFGDAGGYGSTGGIHLNQPILAMAATADGRGYWLVASDGGIFPFGDAAGLGSTGGSHLNQPIVGLSARG